LVVYIFGARDLFGRDIDVFFSEFEATGPRSVTFPATVMILIFFPLIDKELSFTIA
jgi:hypothetical protein